jgi:hypothetical protein
MIMISFRYSEYVFKNNFSHPVVKNPSGAVRHLPLAGELSPQATEGFFLLFKESPHLF